MSDLDNLDATDIICTTPEKFGVCAWGREHMPDDGSLHEICLLSRLAALSFLCMPCYVHRQL
jgi:hypothetical protein